MSKCCGTCTFWYAVDESENEKGKCHINKKLWKSGDACDNYIVSWKYIISWKAKEQEKEQEVK